MFAVAFAVFVAADDLTVVTTMLRPIVNDLGIVLPDGIDDAAWVVNAYLVAFVAIMPIAGRLSDVYGRRRVFVAAYALFLVGTVVIPTSTSLGPFLAGRVLTALGGGAMVPVALAVVGDVYPERSRARALGTLAAIETLGWVAGPLYGAVLVRFFDWRLQFWLNVPLALAGLAAVWWALAEHNARDHTRRVDWLGAGLLTTTLVAFDLALLGGAEVQSVSGFDELRGSTGPDLRWGYLVAVLAALAYVRHHRRSADPVLDAAVYRGRGVAIALAVNFLVGAALVIAMVDVPLWVNAMEVDLQRSAVTAGWLLSALTLTMAITSYVGGRFDRMRSRRVTLAGGLAGAALAYLLMGLTWDPTTSTGVMALMLALLGAGLGLTVAPSTTSVVDAAPPDKRGTAAASVMVTRLIGLSVGLSVLTAWGLARFNAARAGIELPSIADPGFEAALIDAQQRLTADAIGETFLATALLALVGVALALRSPRKEKDPHVTSTSSSDRETLPGPQKLLVGAVVALGLLLVGSLVAVWSLFGRLDRAEDDLARVEAGAAIYASQVQGFQTQLVELQPTVADGLDSAIEGLEAFAQSTIDVTVEIDEQVDIATEFVIQQNVTVPINTSIPINETINTTIRVETPLGFDVPVDVSVPVNLDVPIDLDVDIPINETVPVNSSVPLTLDVPISIDVAGTELAALADSLADGLRSLEEVLAGLAG